MTDITWAGERLVLCQDRRLGARAVIAIDDTTLGPAVGGIRFAAYESDALAVEEAVRLAAGMTLKNAVAGLPFGGAKSVVLRGEEPVDRDELFRWFAANVAALDGAYIPGVDIGTSVADLALMASLVDQVCCDDEDPSPWTALGVLVGIRAALPFAGCDGLAGRQVVVQGAGHVGAELVRLLCEEGATVEVADVDGERAAAVAAATGATAIDSREAVDRECDVFAPCAIARVIDSASVPALRCKVIAGAANDTLADDAVAAEVAARGILYVPDFVVNAGGVIHIHALREGWGPEQLRAAVLAIGDRVAAILGRAQDEASLPLTVARSLAAAVLGRPAPVGRAA